MVHNLQGEGMWAMEWIVTPKAVYECVEGAHGEKFACEVSSPIRVSRGNVSHVNRKFEQGHPVWMGGWAEALKLVADLGEIQGLSS